MFYDCFYPLIYENAIHWKRKTFKDLPPCSTKEELKAKITAEFNTLFRSPLKKVVGDSDSVWKVQLKLTEIYLKKNIIYSISRYLYVICVWYGLVGFYVISTIVGYLMPHPVDTSYIKKYMICKHILLITF